MRPTIAIAAALLLNSPAMSAAQTVAPPAPTSAPTAVAPTPDTRSFVAEAARADMLELESSKVALSRTQSEDVRQFAQQVIDDHTNSAANLKDAAAAVKATLPTTMEDADKARLKELEASKPDAFDSAYMRLQVAAHESAVTLYRAYAERGEDIGLRAFAADTLPILEAHLRHAKGMAPGKAVAKPGT